MSGNFAVRSVGPTPFSAGTQAGSSKPPMTYVMSYPLALHYQGGQDGDEILPSRSDGNFFKASSTSGPSKLLTAAQQAVAHDPTASRRAPEFKKSVASREGDFPRDTLHPLISQLQAEENAKYAEFHPEVGYLANARRNGPTCPSHKPPTHLLSKGPRAEVGGSVGEDEHDDGENEDDPEVDYSSSRHRIRPYSKRGDLSTVSGRRFYTEGNAQDPDYYASHVIEFANSQPTSFTSIAAKALANALHMSKSPSGGHKSVAMQRPTFRLLSPEVKDALSQRSRSGRHQVESVVLGKHTLMQPPPLTADEGVDIEAVDNPHDPFAGRSVKAVFDKPDSIDQKDAAPSTREAALGGTSQLGLWSSFVDQYRGASDVDLTEKGIRVLASGHISFFSGITQGPSVSLFLNSRGIRQGDAVKQPTQLSKSSFLETGVIPSTHFTDLELVPPNAVGFDSERLSIIFRNYGRDIKEISLEGCTWISSSALSLIATYCRGLKLLNLSGCTQVNDSLISSISQACTELKAVNLSNTGVTCEGLHALLSHTSLEALFLASVEGVDASCDAAWGELFKHPNLKFFDASFCFHLTDSAVVSLSRHCQKLEVLDVSGCSNLTDLSVLSIGFSLRNLRVLHLRLCTQLTAESLSSIGHVATSVEDLSLTGLLCVATPVIDELLCRCPDVRKLTLRGCNKIDDSSLQQIAKRCANLEELDISGNLLVTLTGLMKLVHEQKSLRRLDISDCKLSGAEERILGTVREACSIVRCEHKPRALTRIHIYKQVDAPKKKPSALPDAKKKR